MCNQNNSVTNCDQILNKLWPNCTTKTTNCDEIGGAIAAPLLNLTATGGEILPTVCAPASSVSTFLLEMMEQKTIEKDCGIKKNGRVMNVWEKNQVYWFLLLRKCQFDSYLCSRFYLAKLKHLNLSENIFRKCLLYSCWTSGGLTVVRRTRYFFTKRPRSLEWRRDFQWMSRMMRGCFLGPGNAYFKFSCKFLHFCQDCVLLWFPWIIFLTSKMLQKGERWRTISYLAYLPSYWKLGILPF